MSHYVETLLERGETVTYRAQVRWVAYVTALLWFLLALWPGEISRLASTELALTNRRLIGKRGLFFRQAIALPHKQVESVRVRQGGLGRLFDYGSVVVRSKEGRKLTFRGIAYPLELQQVVEEAVEVAILGKTLSHFTRPPPL